MLFFYLALCYNIHCIEWGVFILLLLGALQGLVEFCADCASQRIQASVLKRTLLCDLFVCCAFFGSTLCGTLLPLCLHVQKQSLQQQEAKPPELAGTTCLQGLLERRALPDSPSKGSFWCPAHGMLSGL